MLRCGECGWEGTKAGKKAATKYLPERKVCPRCTSLELGNVPLNELPGRCHVCAGTDFKLMYVNRCLVRECQDDECGVWFDVTTEKEWED
jgi:hypothetical protein